MVTPSWNGKVFSLYPAPPDQMPVAAQVQCLQNKSRKLFTYPYGQVSFKWGKRIHMYTPHSRPCESTNVARTRAAFIAYILFSSEVPSDRDLQALITGLCNELVQSLPLLALESHRRF